MAVQGWDPNYSSSERFPLSSRRFTLSLSTSITLSCRAHQPPDGWSWAFPPSPNPPSPPQVHPSSSFRNAMNARSSFFLPDYSHDIFYYSVYSMAITVCTEGEFYISAALPLWFYITLRLHHSCNGFSSSSSSLSLSFFFQFCRMYLVMLAIVNVQVRNRSEVWWKLKFYYVNDQTTFYLLLMWELF